MEALKHAHSGIRWIVLIVLIVAVINAFLKWKGNKTFTAGDKKINLFTLIFTHIQVTIGAILYFNSGWVQFGPDTMKDSTLRFFTVEHPLLMIISVALITVGYSKSKRATTDADKFKFPAIFYLIGLIAILAAIPWPFRIAAAGWF